MKRDEAALRIDALIQAHKELLEDLQRVRKWLTLSQAQEELLEDLHRVREWLEAGDYDSSDGRRELAQEATIHTRKLRRLVQGNRALTEDDDEQGLGGRQHQEVAQDPQAGARP